MKRFLVLLSAVGIGVVLGRMFDGVTNAAEAAGGQGAGGTVSESGDVNGDGAINLSDATYLLNWLFAGGPEPEPCESGSSESSRLPDTGQTICYDAEGSEIPCDSDTCAGQDGFYATGCPSEGRFVYNGDGTVTDNCTGLMWQADTADMDGDGVINEQEGSGDLATWCEALAYCEKLSLAGYDDWRLPNVRELQSIVDCGRVDPSSDPVFRAARLPYWSSTSFQSPFFHRSAWQVDSAGATFFADKSIAQGAVRGVRIAL